MANKIAKSTEYSKIYDMFYSQFAKQLNYKITNGTKVKIIDAIFEHIGWVDQQAIRACIRYRSYDMASKNTGIPKAKLIKQYRLANKHMYWPENIAKAVPKYYKMKSTKNKKMLTPDDFYGNKYIITALNKSGIYYKEQLMKHLSNGYYFLYTLPGCGDNARISIQMAIDKWSGIERNYLNTILAEDKMGLQSISK